MRPHRRDRQRPCIRSFGPGKAIPQRLHGVGVPGRLRGARRDDFVGPVHRRTGQPGDPRPVRTISGTGCPVTRHARGIGAPDQTDRLFCSKARLLLRMAVALTERHDGAISARMKDLVDLPGVGRKTANGVLGHALGIPGFPVDRDVLRVTNRLRIARGDDPVVVEQQLCSNLSRQRWTHASDTLILHGRRICKPRPLCNRCAAKDDCAFHADLNNVTTSKQRPHRRTPARSRR